MRNITRPNEQEAYIYGGDSNLEQRFDHRGIVAQEKHPARLGLETIERVVLPLPNSAATAGNDPTEALVA